jgi:hypothetical protein
MGNTGHGVVRWAVASDRPGERGPGPIWGGWWLWEPPVGKTKEVA